MINYEEMIMANGIIDKIYLIMKQNINILLKSAKKLSS